MIRISKRWKLAIDCRKFIYFFIKLTWKGQSGRDDSLKYSFTRGILGGWLPKIMADAKKKIKKIKVDV